MTSFVLSPQTTFVWDASGNRSIEGGAILPYDTDFDFFSDNIAIQAINDTVLQPLIDPYLIGQRVNLNFDANGKDALEALATSDVFTQTDYDNATIPSYVYANPAAAFIGSALDIFGYGLAAAEITTAIINTGVVDYTYLDKDIIYGTSGEDTLSYDSHIGLLTGSDPYETGAYFVGGGDDDILIGGDNDDVLSGGQGSDLLYGGGGSDTLYGGADNDTLDGGDGDDLLQGGGGSDTFDGGDGYDTISYADAASGVSIDLSGSNGPGGAASGDALSSIEAVIGSEYADTLTGNDDSNIIYGLGGNDTISGEDGDDLILGGAGGDTIDGGDGYDIISYTDATSGIVVDLTGSLSPSGGATGDTLSSFEEVWGSEFNDHLITADNEWTSAAQGRGGSDWLESANDDVFTGLDGGDSSDYLCMTGTGSVGTHGQVWGGAGNDVIDARGSVVGNTLLGGVTTGIGPDEGHDVILSDDPGGIDCDNYSGGGTYYSALNTGIKDIYIGSDMHDVEFIWDAEAVDSESDEGATRELIKGDLAIVLSSGDSIVIENVYGRHRFNENEGHGLFDSQSLISGIDLDIPTLHFSDGIESGLSFYNYSEPSESLTISIGDVSAYKGAIAEFNTAWGSTVIA
jgi:Ca2+-binding RTX toxin-like protein